AAGPSKLTANAVGFKLATKTNVLVVDDGLTVIDLTLAVNSTAGSGGSTVTSPWPQPKFSFSVEFTVNGKTSKLYAQEVSGLEEANEIEYRHGNDKVFSTLKMPGLKGHGDITLKKGNFVNDDTFVKWYDQRLQNVIQHGTVVISLLDEKGGVTMSWTLKNAFPQRMIGANLALGQFETIVLAHEGLSIKK
ncbi:MAG TPA: phage tail protein, partial [Pyrinomonadaceae bacterium]|nr:phage tail protein [Pyrinomonadaceae bacterium]